MADNLTISVDSFGLNKAARIKAEMEANERTKAPPPLDPDFPFAALPFDPLFFEVMDDHEPL